MKKGKLIWRTISSFFLTGVLFIFILLLKSMNWCLDNFSGVECSTIIYQLFSPMKGTGVEIFHEYCILCLYPSLFWCILFCLLYNICDAILDVLILNIDFCIWNKPMHLTVRKQFKMIGVGILFLIMCLNLKKQAIQIGFFEYMESISNKSELYEQEYVDPHTVNITFPIKKRNLLFIYMESMETTYASVDDGGGKQINYIPGLTQLAEKNTYFSDDNDLGGASSCKGTDWTIAGLLSSSSGVNYKLPIQGNSAGNYENFLQGLITLGDILDDAGYQNYFMCGSDAEFAGRKNFYEQHGNYHIFDYYSAIEDNIIPKDYYAFWGMEDRYLYEYSKQKLTDIAKSGDAFNFTMLTIDTHHQDGYICELCKNKYEEQYANVISCADAQICHFLDWVKKQKWYENTTVVVIGDHCSMTTDFWNDIGNYERRIYNCFINLPDTLVAKETKNRKFSSLDMFPTILTSIGVRIEGERLGLGVDLFSGEETLLEKMGDDVFNKELELYSDYYFKHFITVIKE